MEIIRTIERRPPRVTLHSAVIGPDFAIVRPDYWVWHDCYIQYTRTQPVRAKFLGSAQGPVIATPDDFLKTEYHYGMIVGMTAGGQNP